MLSKFARSARKASTLVVAEHNNNGLNAATLSSIAAASKLGDVSVLVASDNTKSAAEAVGNVAGVSKVVAAESANLTGQLPEAVGPVVQAVAESISWVF